MANGNGDKLFNPTPGIGLEEQEEKLDGPLMLQGRGVADEIDDGFGTKKR